MPVVADTSGAEINELLAYQALLRLLTPSDANKSLLELGKQPGSAKVSLRRAMLLASLKGSGDMGRAQVLADSVAQSGAADEQGLKPLAQFLGTAYGDARRQEESLEKLNVQIREGQRRNDHLNEKLEALKNIERTLSVRPAAPVPAAK